MDSVLDFLQQNCNIRLISLYGFKTFWAGCKPYMIRSLWAERAELFVKCVIVWLHSLLFTHISTNKTFNRKVTPCSRKLFTNYGFHFWSKWVLQILIWNKWDNVTLKLSKNLWPGPFFENHEISKLYSCNFEGISQLRVIFNIKLTNIDFISFKMWISGKFILKSNHPPHCSIIYWVITGRLIFIQNSLCSGVVELLKDKFWDRNVTIHHEIHISSYFSMKSL